MGSATWTADGYTYSMSLFTQAEIDAAKASGKKVDVLKTQSDITEDNTVKAKAYKKAIDNTITSVKGMTEVITAQTAIEAVRASLGGAEWWKPKPEVGYLGVSPGGTYEEQAAAAALVEAQMASYREPYWTEMEYTKNIYTGLQKGGIVTQPTMAMIGEAGPEAVIPLNEAMGGITINFTQPVFFDREDTMNKFVDMIRKGIQRQDRLRFGGAYAGG